MSAKTDNALQSIQNIIAFGMPHKDDMYAVQGYCDMLKKEIAELEADIETLHTDLNTIVPAQDEEIERLTEERDAWKATAGRMAEWMSTCSRCPFSNNKNRCSGNCDIQILARFAAPEEDA